MPPKESSPRRRQPKCDEDEPGFQVDLLDTSAEGGGITHITFCGKKAIAFNNIVNLRLLLGGTQFYLVERVTQRSPLADAVATISHDVGSDWFQLCACDADLPVGAFRVREGGEYWVAHGDLVDEADEEPAATLAELLAHTVDDLQDSHAEQEKAETEKETETKRASLPHKKNTTKSTSPLVTPHTDEPAQAEDTTLSSKKARASRAKRVPSSDKEVVDAPEPVETTAPVIAEISPEASAGKRRRPRKETPEAILDPLLAPETVTHREPSTSPRHTVSSASGVESPAARVAPRAGSDPQRTAAATLSASRLLSSGATDVVADEHQQHEREEGARQFAPITLGTPPQSPTPDALKKKPQGSSSPPRTQAAPAEHVLLASPSLDTAHKKAKKDKQRKRDREETPAPLPEPPANEEAVTDSRNQDNEDEAEEGDNERRRRKKEKKERKERDREEEALRTEATGSDEAVSGGNEKHPKDPLAEKEKKHKKDKKEKKHKRDKTDKSDKKEKKHKKSRTTQSNSPARPSVSPSGIVQPSEALENQPLPSPHQQQQQQQRKESPALNPPPAMESPAISPSRVRKHSSLSATPRVSPKALNAGSPANLPQRSPEPVYSNAPTPPPQALPSPGLVLAPSPPLASPALGFTPVVNSLAEEFSLDNHSLSSFSTDSEYLYE